MVCKEKIVLEKILVVSPHPDDETLGAGGSLLKFKSQGSKIYWLNVTNMREKYGYSKQQVTNRKNEVNNVKKLYNVDKYFDLGLKPASLEYSFSSKYIDKIASIYRKIKPTTLIVPYKNDIHSDHRFVYKYCFSLSKIFRQPSIKCILMMEILSETDFVEPDNAFSPNFFVDITDFLDQKLLIMEKYKSELGEHPFPRNIDSIRSLASIRGVQAGCKYAESFRLVKGII